MNEQSPSPKGEGYWKYNRTNIKNMESRVIVSNGSVRQVLADIYEDINWAYLAKNYFGK